VEKDENFSSIRRRHPPPLAAGWTRAVSGKKSPSKSAYYYRAAGDRPRFPHHYVEAKGTKEGGLSGVDHQITFTIGTPGGTLRRSGKSLGGPALLTAHEFTATNGPEEAAGGRPGFQRGKALERWGRVAVALNGSRYSSVYVAYASATAPDALCTGWLFRLFDSERHDGRRFMFSQTHNSKRGGGLRGFWEIGLGGPARYQCLLNNLHRHPQNGNFMTAPTMTYGAMSLLDETLPRTNGLALAGLFHAGTNQDAFFW